MISKITLWGARKASRSRCWQWGIRSVQQQSFDTNHYCSTSTAGTEETQQQHSDWARPKEIPFQPKIANSVKLIGHVHAPIHLTRLSSSSSLGPNLHWAAATELLLTNHHAPTSFSIPILFEGDLAKVAASHLKKGDHVHVAGRLSAPPPESSHSSDSRAQHEVQVMVSSINFIKGPYSLKNSLSPNQGEASLKNNEDVTLNPWKDLFANPKKWLDYRSHKSSGSVKQNHPDFKHKDGICSLWLDRAPQSVLAGFGRNGFEVKADIPKVAKRHKGDEFWEAFVESPDKWWDNRLDKKNPKAPDFKHKETGEGVWLSDAPTWVLSELPSPKMKPNTFGGKADTLLS